MICKYSHKRQTRAPYYALYSSPRQRTVGAPPPLPTRKPGLKSGPPTRISSEPYLHVMNNNTKGGILHDSRCN